MKPPLTARQLTWALLALAALLAAAAAAVAWLVLRAVSSGAGYLDRHKKASER